MGRLYNLDYLRGLAAFGIMIYHYLTWTLGKFSADDFLGRLGVYGVSVFYVLSGLTLYYVYFHKMQPTRQELVSFFKKRILRIFPLLWLVTLVAILLSGEVPNWTNLALNLSGLFGFIKWDAYFSAGVWSIGNELVFYVFFPFFILFTKRFKPLMVLLSLSILGLYLYFAFDVLPHSSEAESWKNYLNPLNQVFLFLGGFLMGLFFHKAQYRNSFILTLLVLSCAAFVLYPVSGDQFNVKTGVPRLVFTALSFLVCFSFYKLTTQLPRFIHKPLTLLGEASYSLYLLHPIVYNLVGLLRDHTVQFPESIRLALSTILTLLLSYFVYHYFERFFMKLGRKKSVAAG